MENKNKKILNKKTALIAGIVLFCLIVPQIANANVFESVGKDILYAFGQALHYVLNWALKAAAAVFEGVLDIGFDSNIIKVAKIGWNVTRDFANMFFILFLVIIAFSTILRNEKYGIKTLLPKVIGIALLINFSFVLSAAIIDFSNITADFFIKDIRNKIQGENNKKGIISATFADSLNLTGVFIIYEDCEKFKQDVIEECNKLKALGFLPTTGYNLCILGADEKYQECKKYGSTTVENPNIQESSFLNLFLSMTVGSAIILIAAFTLFAGAVLLLIRIIMLWLLIVIVPLAFLCIIMPALNANWKKWLNAFLSWCFFAPAYAFFIWMAMQIAVAESNKGITANIQNAPPGSFGPGATPFVLDPGAQLISYGVIIAFLLGGLIMAKQLGIYGAKTAITIGQKWGKRATGITKFEKYMAARKKVREEEKKTAVQRKLRLREVSGVRQAIKERMPGELGRRARARKAEVIQTESDRMLKHYRFEDMRRAFGYRGFTGFRRTSRLAAARALAHRRYTSQRRHMPPTQLNQLAQRLAMLLRRYGVHRP